MREMREQGRRSPPDVCTDDACPQDEELLSHITTNCAGLLDQAGFIQDLFFPDSCGSTVVQVVLVGADRNMWHTEVLFGVHCFLAGFRCDVTRCEDAESVT